MSERKILERHRYLDGAAGPRWYDARTHHLVEELVSEHGISVHEAMQRVGQRTGRSRSTVYRAWNRAAARLEQHRLLGT